MKAIDFFHIMTKGGKVRLNQDGRDFWGQHGKKTWLIMSISCGNELTICDDNHTVLNGVSFNQVTTE